MLSRQVILGGYAGDHPPAEEAGFLDFAGSLPAPTLRAAIESAEPLSPITRYRATQNVRKVWEEVQVPEGLCIAGDAVCALNPIYGQVRLRASARLARQLAVCSSPVRLASADVGLYCAGLLTVGSRHPPHSLN